MLYQNGRYQVEVGNDGAIKVKPGDWLSKYSAAIYNNFTNIYDFARKDNSGSLTPIQNVNLIYAGETIYHLPTYYSSFSPMEITVRRPPPAPQMPDIEKKRIIEESLKKEFNLRGDNLPVLSKAIDILGYAENAATLAEIAGLVAEGGVVASAGTALSIAGCFLFPIGATIALMNAWETGQRLVGMRAIAYGTTAWAFDDPMPPYPSVMRNNVISGGFQHEVADHERAWNNARDSAVRNLEEEVMKKRVQKKSYQVMLRAVGNDNRNNLVKELMKGLEKSLTRGSIRDAFWSPEPNYPN